MGKLPATLSCNVYTVYTQHVEIIIRIRTSRIKYGTAASIKPTARGVFRQLSLILFSRSYNQPSNLLGNVIKKKQWELIVGSMSYPWETKNTVSHDQALERNFFKDIWHVQHQSKLWFCQNFSDSRCKFFFLNRKYQRCEEHLFCIIIMIEVTCFFLNVQWSYWFFRIYICELFHFLSFLKNN